MDYGLTNTRGKIQDNAVRAVLKRAQRFGVEVLDTAALYGDSEATIGRCLPENHQFRIVTKTPVTHGADISSQFIDSIGQAFRSSLERLGVPKVDGLLVHHASDLTKPRGQEVLAQLCRLRDLGLVRKIGVSVYDGQEIDEVLHMFTPDIVQLPVSIFDQRLVHSGHLAKLKDLGVEVHGRSLFLQGAALSPSHLLPSFFDPVRRKFELLEHKALELGVEKITLCLMFAHQLEPLDVALVGVTSLDEFEGILGGYEAAMGLSCDCADLGIEESLFLNPALWPS